MRHVLFVALVVALSGDWRSVAKETSASVVRVDSDSGYCSGFVIHKTNGFVLTAAHCDANENMFVNDQPANVVLRDEADDLEVLQVQGLRLPALKLGKGVVVGEEVLNAGMGRVRHAWVSGAGLTFPEESITAPQLVLDSAVIPGMSGSPVVNSKGEVVSMVQRSSYVEALGPLTETLRAKTGKYWEKK